MEEAPLDKDIFQYYSTHDITELLTAHVPFNDIEIISKKGERNTCYCAVGTKLSG